MTQEKGPQDITGIGQAATGLQEPPPNRTAPITIMGQYVRDISFENPNAPETLYARSEKPQVDISFQMGVQKIRNDNNLDMFEVNLGVTATARNENNICYIAEVEYAVLVALAGIPEDQQHPTLLIKVPELSFPFVRQIIANLTQQGGYMPLMLAPVDFHAMYRERFANRTATATPEQNKAATA